MYDGKDLEGSGRGLIQVPSWHLPGRAEENLDSNRGPRESESRVLRVQFNELCARVKLAAIKQENGVT
jgi:hypothetical protein